MLRGKLVELTELRAHDRDVMFRWINDPETVRFNAPFSPVHEPNHAGWFDSISRDNSRVVLVIRPVSAPQAIGIIQLTDIHRVHRTTELIIRIGEDKNRGKGFGTEALDLAAKFAFDDLNLQRVWLRVFANNERAIRAYDRSGFEVEGRMKRAVFINGSYLDEIIMARLKPQP